jgi:hypothetical protein
MECLLFDCDQHYGVTRKVWGFVREKVWGLVREDGSLLGLALIYA